VTLPYMKILRLRCHSRIRRRIILLFYVLLTLAVALTTAVLIAGLLSSHAKVDERLASAGDVLAGGTLLLALVAAFVALQAYAVTTGLPDLQVQVQFGSSDRNHPVFLASTADNGWLQTTYPASQTTAKIRLRNRSNYAAQDIAMIVHMRGMALNGHESHDGDYWWGTDSIDGVGITTVQWDGGSDFLIHGLSMRRLPDLELGRLWCIQEPNEASIEVEILASPDYRRKVTIPVSFIIDGTSRTRCATGEPARDWL
jgi:hypothetical protein